MPKYSGHQFGIEMANYLTVEQMEKLPTPRLLAYRRKLMTRRWHIEDYVWNCSCEGCKCEKAAYDALKVIITDAKEILNTREHVSKKCS